MKLIPKHSTPKTCYNYCENKRPMACNRLSSKALFQKLTLAKSFDQFLKPEKSNTKYHQSFCS